MFCRFAALAIAFLLVRVAAADRLADVDQLTSDYDAADKAFFERESPANPTPAESIARYEAWPGWEFIPRFVAFAQAKPDDEAAYRCCQWILDRCRNVGNEDARIFAADQSAWQILGTYHTAHAGLPALCLRAVEYYGQAREKFLRDLLAREDLSPTERGFTTVALAELLSRKSEFCEGMFAATAAHPKDEFSKYVFDRRAAEWSRDFTPANASSTRDESIKLFHDVLDHFADIPLTFPAMYFRDINTLSEKAGKSLHALEHLRVGCVAPDIAGKDLQDRPLDLRDYRGKVVVLSFWFSGCGPCMGMVAEERHLVEKYKDQPFALLGVCDDESIDAARKAADEKMIDWPSWFDGAKGPIARDWNVLSWPTIYVLDENGTIAAKDLHDDDLDGKVAELLGK